MKKNFFSNIFITLISIILNFAFKVYLANIVRKDELAIYFSAIDFVSLFLIIFIGARSSMIVHFSKTKDDTAILNIFRLGLFVMVIFSSIFIIPLIQTNLNIQIDYIFFVALLISQAIFTYFFNQMGMYHLYRQTNVITIAEPLLLILLFLLLNQFYSAIHSLLLTTIVNFLVLSYYIFNSKRFPEPKFTKIKFDTQTKEFTQNALIAALEFSLGMLTVYLCVIFFIKYFTLSDLADFQVVVKSIYFYFLSIFVFPIFRFVFPELSKFVATKDIEEIKKLKFWIIKYSFIVSFCFSGLIYFSSDKILNLFGHEYKNAIILLETIILVFFFVIMNAFFTSLLKSFGKFGTTFIIRFIGLLAFIGSFYIYQMITNAPINIIYAFISGHIVIFALLYIFSNRILDGYYPNYNTGNSPGAD